MFEGMEYVYAVYQEKSFSKAAQKLFISQPSLSANVKRVEKKVGYPIFDRSTKPLGLTECGEKYIDSVEKILAVEKEFSNYVNDWGDLKNGKLVLGGSSLFSSWVLPPLMGEFSRKYPGVMLELVEESSAKLERQLLSGGIDLMLDNRIPDQKIFDCTVFRREHLLLAVPKGLEVNRKLENFRITAGMVKDGSFLEEERSPVDLKHFSQAPFIMLKQENDTGKRAAELCRQNGFVPEITFELDQQMTSYNITCSGMGISFISNTLISHVPECPDVVYYRLQGKGSSRKLYFYWKKGRYFSRAMEEFLKIAKEYPQ